MKKPDYILSLPEMSFCSEKNRERRCRREPKCQHVNCLRNAQNSELSALFRARWRLKNIIELCESKNGYDAGFIKDEYDCNLSKCLCANFDKIVIGKLELLVKCLAKNSIQGTLQSLKKQFPYWWRLATIRMQFGGLILIRELIFGIEILPMVDMLLLMNSTPVYIRNLKLCFQM